MYMIIIKGCKTINDNNQSSEKTVKKQENGFVNGKYIKKSLKNGIRNQLTGNLIKWKLNKFINKIKINWELKNE